MTSIIQPRDKELMAALDRFGILSSRQIKEKFFTKAAATTMHRRLRILEKRKLIRRSLELDDGMSTWTLGAMGILNAARCPNDGAQVPQNPYSNRNTIQHEVILSELRMCLEQLGIGHDWTTEWNMKRAAIAENWRDVKDRIIPDGLMIEEIKGKRYAIAVELEITPKSYARYVSIIEKYFRAEAIEIAWYFVSSLSQAKILTSAFNQARNTSQWRRANFEIYVSCYSELFTIGRDAKLILVPANKIYQIKHVLFDAWQTGAHTPAQGVSTQNEIKSAVPVETKPIESHHNSQNSTEAEGRPFASDPSPSTSERKGSEATAEDSNSKNENCDVTDEFKQCG